MGVRKSGFTLIEMLVVISIIGVLIGLLMPAVNNARETARRAECANNMRNVALAITSFSTAKGKLPPRGRYLQDFPADGDTETYLGSGSGSGNGSDSFAPAHSWVVDILPFMDQAAIHRQWNVKKVWYTNDTTVGSSHEAFSRNRTLANTHIRVLTCPDDDSASEGGSLSFVVNGGFVFDFQRVGDYNGDGAGTFEDDRQDAEDGGLMWANKSRTIGSITDGASTTIMLTESIRVGYYDEDTSTNSLADSTWANPSNCAFQAPAPDTAGGTTGGDSTRYDDCNTINEPLPGGEYPCLDTSSAPDMDWGRANPSSYHPGGINVVFADGHLQFISETVDGRVWAKLITPRGGRMGTDALKQLPVNENEY